MLVSSQRCYIAVDTVPPHSYFVLHMPTCLVATVVRVTSKQHVCLLVWCIACSILLVVLAVVQFKLGGPTNNLIQTVRKHVATSLEVVADHLIVNKAVATIVKCEVWGGWRLQFA